MIEQTTNTAGAHEFVEVNVGTEEPVEDRTGVDEPEEAAVTEANSVSIIRGIERKLLGKECLGGCFRGSASPGTSLSFAPLSFG